MGIDIFCGRLVKWDQSLVVEKWDGPDLTNEAYDKALTMLTIFKHDMTENQKQFIEHVQQVCPKCLHEQDVVCYNTKNEEPEKKPARVFIIEEMDYCSDFEWNGKSWKHDVYYPRYKNGTDIEGYFCDSFKEEMVGFAGDNKVQDFLSMLSTNPDYVIVVE